MTAAFIGLQEAPEDSAPGGGSPVCGERRSSSTVDERRRAGPTARRRTGAWPGWRQRFHARPRAVADTTAPRTRGEDDAALLSAMHLPSIRHRVRDAPSAAKPGPTGNQASRGGRDIRARPRRALRPRAHVRKVPADDALERGDRARELRAELRAAALVQPDREPVLQHAQPEPPRSALRERGRAHVGRGVGVQPACEELARGVRRDEVLREAEEVRQRRVGATVAVVDLRLLVDGVMLELRCDRQPIVYLL
jgi:hypothetical protein